MCMHRFPALNTLDLDTNQIGGSLPASWGSGSAFPDLLNLVSCSLEHGESYSGSANFPGPTRGCCRRWATAA